MKKRFLIIMVLITLMTTCRDPGGDPSDVIDPDQETTIVFDNTQGICAVTVYSSYQRNEESKIAQIPAVRLSEEIEWMPGAMTFYFSYQISFQGISGFSVDYIPVIGKDQTNVRVDPNIKNTITIPSLAEALSSADTLLSDKSYLLIQNNSSYSLQLLRGTSIITPENLSDTLVNSGERAQYTVNPGAASAYNLMVGGNNIPFPSSLVSFEAGCVYSFVFNNGVLSLTSEIELKLENAAGVSPNKPVPQAPGAPVITASDRLLTVHWTAVEGAENYEVYRSTTQNPPTLPERTVYSSATVLTGLTNKTTYYVWVKAINENGASDFSPRARGIPWPANEVPAVPERPVIIPGINQLTVNWEDCGGASSYEVYINTTPSASSAPVVTSDKTSAVINYLENGSILENGVIYYIWVRAVNNVGKSAYSPVEAGTPRIPTVAPAVPPRPVLTAGNKELAVSWQTVELTSAYEVWFGTSSDSTQAQKFGGDITGTETVITGLANETTYCVWIKAKNVVGTSGFSLPASAMPSAFTALPETPAAPSIIDGNRELFVNWPAAEGALFYEIWTGTINNPANAGKHGADISGTSVILTGLNNGTTYYIWLKSKNNFGTSGFSPMANGMPTVSAAAPSAPSTAPTVTAGSGQLIVNWQAVEGASAYELWAGTTNNSTAATKRGSDISSTSGTITGLTNNTTYYIWLKAKNSVGTSGFSPVASGTPSASLGTPQSPAAPSLVIGNGQINITWAAVDGATSYEVWRGTVNNTASAVKQGADISGTLSTTISGLSNGTTYYIWLKAKNSIGTSGFSPVSFGKPIGTPGTPTVSSDYKQLLVSWTNVAGAEQYEVYCGTGTTPTTLAVTTSGTTATITGLTSGTTFYVRLRAKNSTGVSDYGPSASGVPSDERSPGLYRGNEKIGHQNLNAALSYISANAVSGDDYYIVLGEDESASPMSLIYSGKTVGITLLGYGGERTITTLANNTGVLLGSMFAVNTGVTLTLDENISLISINSTHGALVSVNSNGTFIMNDGTKISGTTSSYFYGGGIYVASGGTFTMNGGSISENTAQIGGGIFVDNGGTVTIHDGTISGNTAKSSSSTNVSGGGIYVASGGTLTMHGGTISGNIVTDPGAGGSGSGVYVGGTFTMHGGTISGNTARFGGGIFVSGGTFTMYGGTISGNTVTNYGGGISVSEGTFTMYGGTISGNTVTNYGGGIYVSSRGTFKKLPPSGGGQNSGIIYGNEVVGNDAEGIPLKNTGNGHAIYFGTSTSIYMRRNTTAWETDHIDTETGMGLSASGEPPYGN